MLHPSKCLDTTQAAAGFDLSAAAETVIPAGGKAGMSVMLSSVPVLISEAVVKTGLSIAVPEARRSSSG